MNQEGFTYLQTVSATYRFRYQFTTPSDQLRLPGNEKQILDCWDVLVLKPLLPTSYAAPLRAVNCASEWVRTTDLLSHRPIQLLKNQALYFSLNCTLW